MENIILVLTVNIILGLSIAKGIKYFSKINRTEKAKERALKQYRREDGKFSKTTNGARERALKQYRTQDGKFSKTEVARKEVKRRILVNTPHGSYYTYYYI